MIRHSDFLIRHFLRVGPEGLEPSPAWVRTRDAAANTSIPRNGDDSSSSFWFRPSSFPKSGWSDSNRRSRASKARGLAATLHPFLGLGLQAGGLRWIVLFVLQPPASSLTVRTAGFEPAIPWPPAKCDTRLRYVLESRLETAGLRLELAMVRFLSSSLRSTVSSLFKAPSGSRTRTSAMARQ